MWSSLVCVWYALLQILFIDNVCTQWGNNLLGSLAVTYLSYKYYKLTLYSEPHSHTLTPTPHHTPTPHAHTTLTDFAVGAPYYMNEGVSDTGAVFIYYGRANMTETATQKPFMVSRY